jgi:hypothetical protein
MSEYKICKGNGKAGVQITFSDKVRSQYSQKMIPLETDGSTFHKHYEPTATTTNQSNPTPAAAKTITPTEQHKTPEDFVRCIPSPPIENNLNVIKVLHAALSEYIAMKEAGLEK